MFRADSRSLVGTIGEFKLCVLWRSLFDVPAVIPGLLRFSGIGRDAGCKLL